MINFNPYKTYGNAPGFNTSSQGYVQGDAQDDPAIQLTLESGMIDTTVTKQIFPGFPITALASARGPQNTNGGAKVKPAAPGNAVNAWCVSNRNYHGIITPGNPVPSWGASESVHFYRTGSGARIPLPIGPDIIPLVNAGGDLPKFYWHRTNNYISAVDASSSQDPDGELVSVILTDVDVNGTIIVVTSTGEIQWSYDKPIGVFIV